MLNKTFPLFDTIFTLRIQEEIILTDKILKITNATLTKYLRQNRIKLKGSGNRNARGKLVVE